MTLHLTEIELAKLQNLVFQTICRDHTPAQRKTCSCQLCGVWKTLDRAWCTASLEEESKEGNTTA